MADGSDPGSSYPPAWQPTPEELAALVEQEREDFRNRRVCVYVVRCDVTGLAKIGLSSRPEVRLQSLQTGSPTVLRLEHWQECAAEHEAVLHWHFGDRRAHGEWFRVTPEEALASLKGIRRIAEEYRRAHQSGRRPKKVRYSMRDYTLGVVPEPEFFQKSVKPTKGRQSRGKRR